MGMFAKRPHLSPAVHQFLFMTLVSKGAFRQRYAGAFLAAFSPDLAAKYDGVASASVEAARRRTGNATLDDSDRASMAYVLLCLVATEKFAEFKPLTAPFAPDAVAAIWMVIYAFSDVASSINPTATAVVKSCIEEALGDSRAYFVEPQAVETASEWQMKTEAALHAYDSGAVDSDEFAELAAELFRELPPFSFF